MVDKVKKKRTTLMDIRGIAPDCTGNLSSEEFVRKIRGCEDCVTLRSLVREAVEIMETMDTLEKQGKRTAFLAKAKAVGADNKHKESE